MRRDASAGRRLVEIAVLVRDAGGCVRAETVWHVDDGFGSGASLFNSMVEERCCR